MEFAACFEQSRYLLLEGALGERLKREYGLKIDGIAAMAPLVYDPQAQKALAALWGEYRGIAQKYGLPFLATTPTRRANRERTALAGYDEELLFDNIAFLKQVRQQTGGEQGMYLGALMGCRGDAYRADEVLSQEQAWEFHSWAADAFARAGAEFLYAGIMPAKSEAIGMAQAMERIRKGALYNLGVEKRATMDEAVFDMIGGNCILFFPGADKGSTLYAGNVAGTGSVQQTAGKFFLVEFLHLAGGDCFSSQGFELLLAAINPDNLVRSSERDHLIQPF